MRDAVERFEQNLYQEHLDEASFLYEQRLSLMFRAAVTWTELASLEARRQAHLDALESGGARALNLAVSQASSGAAGDLFVAASLCARLDLFEPLAALSKALPAEPRVSRAWTDALTEAAPEAWAAQLRALADAAPALASAVILWHGQRGIAAAYDWLAGQQERPQTCEALCRCYARLGELRAHGWLDQQLSSTQDEGLLRWLSLALAVLDRQQALARLRAQAMEAWTWLPLALVGSEADGGYLLRHLRGLDTVPAEGFQALGLHGYQDAVPFLLDCLTDAQRAAPAAEALNTLLGAELYEERFVAEEIDPDELNEEERAQFARGERPPNPNGQPAGDWTLGLSLDPQLWRSWWQERSSQFPPGRYRHGEPHAPAVLLEGIRSLGTANLLRRWNALELTIRQGLPWLLNLYAPVATQRRQIQAMAQRIQGS